MKKSPTKIKKFWVLREPSPDLINASIESMKIKFAKIAKIEPVRPKLIKFRQKMVKY